MMKDQLTFTSFMLCLVFISISLAFEDSSEDTGVDNHGSSPSSYFISYDQEPPKSEMSLLHRVLCGLTRFRSCKGQRSLSVKVKEMIYRLRLTAKYYLALFLSFMLRLMKNVSGQKQLNKFILLNALEIQVNSL